MRMLMKVSMPVSPFNELVKEGKAGSKISQIVEEIKPQAAYFTEMNGQRTGLLIVDVPKPSDVPRLAEPWFVNFDANVEFHVVMSPEDLQQAGLDQLGKKYR